MKVKEVTKTPVPMGKRVLAIKEEAPSVSEGGIVLVDGAREQPLFARIIAIGAAVTTISVGDEVAYPAFAGNVFTVGDQDLIVIDEEDIMLTLREVSSDD